MMTVRMYKFSSIIFMLVLLVLLFVLFQIIIILELICLDVKKSMITS